jgi:ketosteroid isomerase-like protein
MATKLPSFIDGTDTGLGADHPLTALAGFYRAFNQRDLDAMARNWNDDDTVSMSNPLGGIARGWPAIRAVYERIFAGNARVQVAFHDFTLHEAGNVFYVVGRERGTLDKGSTHLDLAIRTSRLYRRVDNAWRQAHHHGSFEDAALLAAYGEAVR